jgi:N-acetylglucosamine malate deacetylase 1
MHVALPGTDFIERAVMKVMAVMAHPDDAEIWCGATLILHADKGDSVRICSLSYTRDSARGREAGEGANRMGCEVELLGLQDSAIRDTDMAAGHLTRSMNSFQPDTIITHWYDDTHPDHEATFQLVRRAFVRYLLANAIDKSKDLPRIFCCDTYFSIGLRGPFSPDRFVDVTRFWGRKVAAIKAHESQHLALYLDMIDRQCLAHGQASGTEYAEGFIYLPMFGLPDEGQPLGS